MSVLIQVCVLEADDAPPLYLAEYDVDAHDGRGNIKLTEDPVQALQFPDMATACQVWTAESTVRPLRADGRANRPLTALTVRFTTT